MTELVCFYAKNSPQVGPRSLSEIMRLINNQEVVADTKSGTTLGIGCQQVVNLNCTGKMDAVSCRRLSVEER